MIEDFIQDYILLTIVFMMMTGLYCMLVYPNYIKKIIALNVFQTSIFLFFIFLGFTNSQVPILELSPDLPDDQYANPVPHVLILTAIVVGVSSSAVGLFIASKIADCCQTLDEILISEAEGKENADHRP